MGVTLDDCRAKVVVADRDLRAALGPAEQGRAVDFESLTGGAPAGPVAPEPVGQDAMAFWLYTSGTTGRGGWPDRRAWGS